jgi:MFS family permease
MLPSLVSRVAPADCRGTALGFYSSAQFLGAFLGGTLGGIVQGAYGLHGVFAFAALLASGWLLVAAFMTPPRKLSSYIYRTEVTDQAGAERLRAQLSALAGVAEAAVVVEDGLAYLKVDKQVFDERRLPGALTEPAPQ